ncbi:hypothetical protein [Empedobacter tilapiae]
MMKLINYLIFIMGLNFFSCEDKKQDDFFAYGTREYTLKEASLNIKTDEAALLFSNYYFKENPKEESLTLRLDIIYGDYYIFSNKIILYNAKSGDYITENTYWVNGKTKQIEKSDVKKIKILLSIPKKTFIQEYHN